MRQNYTIDALLTSIIDIISNDNNEARDFVLLASSTKLLRGIDTIYRQKTNEETEISFISTEALERLKQIHHVTDEKTANWKFNRDFEALERTRKQLFTTDKRCLKISTIQSFKGWESPSVIVILESDFALPNTTYRPMSPQTIYTAITRARENMYIINIGNDTYHEFFYNQGTGRFGYGIDEYPTEIVNYVEYLEGDGNSWIDTEIACATDYVIEVGFKKKTPNSSGYTTIYGVGAEPNVGYDHNGGYGIGFRSGSNSLLVKDDGKSLPNVLNNLIELGLDGIGIKFLSNINKAKMSCFP